MVHPNISQNYQKQIQEIESHGVRMYRKSQEDNSPTVGVISVESVLDKPELLEEVFGALQYGCVQSKYIINFRIDTNTSRTTYGYSFGK